MHVAKLNWSQKARLRDSSCMIYWEMLNYRDNKKVRGLRGRGQGQVGGGQACLGQRNCSV